MSTSPAIRIKDPKNFGPQSTDVLESGVYTHRLFEDSAECVALLDLKGRILRMNKEGLRLLKIKNPSKVKNKVWALLWNKDDQLRIKKALTVASKGTTQKLQNIKSGNKRTYRYWNITILAVFDDQHQVKQLVAMCHDITSQKETEQVLRYNELLIQNVSDAILSADMKLKLLSWNKGAEELYGWKAKEVIGKSVRKFITTTFPNNDHRLATQQILTHGSWRGELSQTDKNGKVHDILATLSLVKQEDGTSIGIVGVCKDITEKNRTEKKLQKSTLQQQLIRHKAKILKQKNDELLALSRSKDEFIAITSHQLRTPATGVKQYIGLLLEGYADPITEGQKVFLRKAYENNERQLRIVDDILRIAQVDLDKVKLHLRKSDLGEIVDDAVASLQAKFGARHQTVHVIKHHKAVMARVDTGQIRLVVENILENASNYSFDESKITITIDLTTDGDTLLKIADEGVGIDAADFSKLFQKFSRINNTRSNSVSGTGLGLYFAKKIIELHNGHIKVESTPNEGTAFTISLPENL